MADNTGIEYLDATWNPVRMRCTPVSAGCKNCWHIAMLNRFGHVGPYRDYSSPREWKKPRRIGVQFMGDLFHEAISDGERDIVFNIIRKCSQHTFLILTKRPTAMHRYFLRHGSPNSFSNVWMGVSIELTKHVDRFTTLLSVRRSLIECPIIWVSVEPMLGPVRLNVCAQMPDWVVCGSEAGGIGSRRCSIDWVRELRDQCIESETPFFYKQGPGDGSGEFIDSKLPAIDGVTWTQYPDSRGP